MFSMSLFQIVLVTLVVSLCNGDDNKDDQSIMERFKKCNGPDWMLNLKTNRLMGEWFPQLTTYERETKMCYTIKFKATRQSNSDGEFFFKRNNIVIFITQFKNTSEFHAYYYTLEGIWVVDTDHRSWAVWFICSPDNPTGAGLVVTTRERKPDKVDIQSGEEAAKRFSPELSKLLKEVNRTECPKPPKHTQ